jgi:AAA domain
VPAVDQPVGGAVVLEIVGPPGSGKTTLADAIAAARPDAVRIKDYRRPAYAAMNARAAVAVAPVVAALMRRAGSTSREAAHMARIEATPMISAALRRRATLVAFDQGPLYSMTRLDGLVARSGENGRFRDWWSRARRRTAGALDLLVVVDAGDDTLLQRVDARPKEHAAKRAPEERARAIIARERMRIETALAALVGDRGPEVLRISTDECSAREAAARVLDATASLGDRHRGRGLVVAVIGSDGSGKSTLSRDLVVGAASGAMVDSLAAASPGGGAVHVYFGSGDGPASVVRLPMKLARDRLLTPRASVASGDGHASTAGDRAAAAIDGSARRDAADGRRTISGTRGRMSRWMPAAKAAWALALAEEKRRKLRRALAAADEGALVVCDRYPQVQVEGRNDGPLLGRWRRSENLVLRRLGEWEARPYAEAARVGPDVVLRLNVDDATAASRRPGLDPGYLSDRIRLVRSLRFDGAKLVELDAGRPYAEVLADAAGAVAAAASRREKGGRGDASGGRGDRSADAFDADEER